MSKKEDLKKKSPFFKKARKNKALKLNKTAKGLKKNNNKSNNEKPRLNRQKNRLNLKKILFLYLRRKENFLEPLK